MIHDSSDHGVHNIVIHDSTGHGMLNIVVYNIVSHNFEYHFCYIEITYFVGIHE